jgi:hypothetical protein
MKQLIDLMGLNVLVIQTGVLIWGVFEVRLMRFKFLQHMVMYHGEKRRSTDSEEGEV